LARIEQGRLDPGLRRLQALLSLYGLPIQAAGDLLELEAIAGGRSAKGDFETLLDRGNEAWKSGDLPTAVSCYLAMRHRAKEQGSDRAKRQEAILSFAVLAAKLGKHHIARQMLDDLILELRDSLGTTVVIVTHELSSIFSIGNNAVFLDPITKTQLATGDPKELRDHSPNFVVRNFLLRGTAEPVE
jgi:hypothetical protein